LKGRGEKIIRSPAKRVTPHMAAPPSPPLLTGQLYPPAPSGYPGSSTRPTDPLTPKQTAYAGHHNEPRGREICRPPSKKNEHNASPRLPQYAPLNSDVDPSSRLGPLEVKTTLKTARNLTSPFRKEDAHLQAPYHILRTHFTQTQDARGVSPANLRLPTHYTLASPAHPGPPTHYRGVSPALNSGSSQAGGFTMRATLVWDAPPSHAQSESPSRPVNLNPHFRLGQNSPSQWQR